jgi:hypothetical protein
LCKKPLSERIQVKDEVVNLIDFGRPEGNYIMLETFTREKLESKYIYIIQMNDKSVLRLGRSNESDVRLSDISISRNHASLRVMNDSFYLDDISSKFGTLVQTCNKITIIPTKQISLQVGRFFYNFNMRRTFWAFLSCYEYIIYNSRPKECKFTDYNQYFDTVVNNISNFQTDYTGLEKVSRYESDKNSLSNTLNKIEEEDHSNNKTSIINEKNSDENR